MKPNERERAIAKTLLALWPHLESYGSMLQGKIMKSAIASFDTPLPAEKIMDRIIDLNVKCQTIRNLKSEIDLAIGRLEKPLQKTVREYFGRLDREKTAKDIAKEHGMSERSFFRSVDGAIDRLAEELEGMGINAFTWANLLIHHSWIKETFSRQYRPARAQNPTGQTR